MALEVDDDDYEDEDSHADVHGEDEETQSDSEEEASDQEEDADQWHALPSFLVWIFLKEILHKAAMEVFLPKLEIVKMAWRPFSALS